jgi:hypothetical protein
MEDWIDWLAACEGWKLLPGLLVGLAAAAATVECLRDEGPRLKGIEKKQGFEE